MKHFSERTIYKNNKESLYKKLIAGINFLWEANNFVHNYYCLSNNDIEIPSDIFK